MGNLIRKKCKVTKLIKSINIGFLVVLPNIFIGENEINKIA